jgi:ribosomal protein L37AE/L43A
MALPVDERDDFQPLCPHCGEEMHKLLARTLSSILISRRLLYCCPHCKKAIGVSHRKGGLWGS